MRCSNCGLPLSPSRISCPRCGTIYNASSRQVKSEQNVLPSQGSTSVPGNMPPRPNVQPGQAGAEVPYAQWNAYPAPTFHEAPAGYSEQTAMEAGQESFPASSNEQAFFDPSPTVPRPPSYQTPQPLQQGWTPAAPSQAMSEPSGWMPTPASIRPF